MQPYALDLRRRARADCDQAPTARAVATKYSVSQSWAQHLEQRRRQSGELAPRAAAPRQPSRPAYAEQLRAAIAATPTRRGRNSATGWGGPSPRPPSGGPSMPSARA